MKHSGEFNLKFSIWPMKNSVCGLKTCLRAYFLYIRKTGKYFVSEQNKSYVVDPEVSMKGQVRKTVSRRDSKAQEHAEAVEQLIAPELL
jgi:cytochrome oxidase Cu insertion factor (SCO1/SenC/PrrC family)